MSSRNYKSDERIVDSGSDGDNSDIEFVAPSGYKKVSSLAKNVPSLKDKQIWLIQIPPNIDLSKVKSLPVAFDSHSEPTFSINNSLYSTSLEEQNPSSRIRLLVPSSDGEELKVASKSISKYYKITEQVNIRSIDIDKVNVPKPVVEQKTGLYMRHFPTGYGASEFKESKPKQTTEEFVNSITAETESHSQSAKKEKREKKHKHHDADEADRPKKKKKKSSSK